ncbi:transglutaminase family protein [Agriterribacter sp.]|uniref:transglutaminase family protein n=1 Tax=Agriterribacter sp. TaxID=2821509 RepID=UPI002B5D29AE|nr:transglutaminase family protein [Agriterribacter sp.]HTN09180.1 transglutaminase family protein [Agriterribacter sp.]
MEETREINALLHLIDDPDHEVFDTVSNRIVSYGRPIIPNLEHLWENTPDEMIQGKIELLIHRLHFQELQANMSAYAKSTRHDLLEGSLLVARYQYPDMADTPVLQEIEKIKRNIWLELNSYLTALEQVNIINRIFFTYYKFKGVEVSYQHPEEFLINKVLETKRGNSIINGILLQLLCGLLDIPVKAIQIPRQYLLAYFDTAYDYFNPKKENGNNILFYIDPMNGQVYTHKDVESYFKKIGVPITSSYFKPMDHRRIFQFLLEELAKCFDTRDNRYKQTELLALAGAMGYDNTLK